MNRIILIGNGFDLAHGLETSYGNFIDWYWRKWRSELRSSTYSSLKDELCEFSLKDKNSGWLAYLFTNQLFLSSLNGFEFINYLKQCPEITILKCDFLERISHSVETKGWVDIENEYYNLLVSCYKYEIFELTHPKLNIQLRHLQDLLCEYLRCLHIDKVELNENIKNIIYEPFKPKDISISNKIDLQEHVDYWSKCDEVEFRLKLENYKKINILDNDQRKYNSRKVDYNLEYLSALYPTLFLPNNILLLNFNYTPTTKKYLINKSIFTINHIHGELSNPDSVIFGYGDELDENYKKLSNLNDNEYLKNFKSIKYLESDRYRKALQFMEAEPYQVYIMGHSCGNSDRTFLNTLFEHKNCVSIKPYYYKDGDKDNYLDIVQNISRNFTDMKLMRDRVVNKTYCEPFSKS